MRRPNPKNINSLSGICYASLGVSPPLGQEIRKKTRFFDIYRSFSRESKL
jgi:hypothetical protein